MKEPLIAAGLSILIGIVILSVWPLFIVIMAVGIWYAFFRK